MRVDDLDIVVIRDFPSKANMPLVVDSNAVLPLSITAEFLQPIPRRHAQIVECLGGIDGHELAEHDTTEISRKPPHRLSSKQPFGVAIAEGLYHPL